MLVNVTGATVTVFETVTPVDVDTVRILVLVVESTVEFCSVTDVMGQGTQSEGQRIACGAVSLRAMAALAVMAALVETDELAAEVVLTAADDIELGGGGVVVGGGTVSL